MATQVPSVDSAVWHVFWRTRHDRPLRDLASIGAELRTLYADGSTERVNALLPGAISAIAAPPDVGGIKLSAAEAVLLTGWAAGLLGKGGDGVAGGHHLVSCVFLPTQAHILFACPDDRLNQVVGRLKSRLATLVLYRPDRAGQESIWASGFGRIRIDDGDVIAAVADVLNRSA